MITPEEARTRATENFKSGLNCTQAVALTFAEELGFDPATVKAMVQPFGGGMCRMREVCGTVSGMMVCLGMKNARDEKYDASKQKKDDTYAIGQEFARQFREINGSIICRELLGLVPMGTSERLMAQHKADPHKASEPVSEERTADYYKKRPCAELCGIAAGIFAQWLNGQDSKQDSSGGGVRV